MSRSEHEFLSWKSEQISYFQSYLANFRKDSEEYSILTQGIEELKKTI